MTRDEVIQKLYDSIGVQAEKAKDSTGAPSQAAARIARELADAARLLSESNQV